jgi:hypothetical protein
MGWAVFWATFSQTYLVTLIPGRDEQRPGGPGEQLQQPAGTSDPQTVLLPEN